MAEKRGRLSFSLPGLCLRTCQDNRDRAEMARRGTNFVKHYLKARISHQEPQTSLSIETVIREHKTTERPSIRMTRQGRPIVPVDARRSSSSGRTTRYLLQLRSSLANVSLPRFTTWRAAAGMVVFNEWPQLPPMPIHIDPFPAAQGALLGSLLGFFRNQFVANSGRLQGLALSRVIDPHPARI